MDSQQTRVVKSRRGRKLYRRRMDTLEAEFRQEMAKSDEQLSELLESVGTTKNDTERDSAGARITEGWEQLVKTTATKVVGGKLIFRSSAQ